MSNDSKFPNNLDGAVCFVFENGIVLWVNPEIAKLWLTNYIGDDDVFGTKPINTIGRYPLDRYPTPEMVAEAFAQTNDWTFVEEAQ